MSSEDQIQERDADRVDPNSDAPVTSVSFFHRSSGIAIDGGTFIGRQENTYFIANPADSPRLLVGPITSNPPNTQIDHNNRTPADNQNGRPTPLRLRLIEGFAQFQAMLRPRRRSRLTITTSGAPEDPISEQEVYKKHMYPKRLGYPLWIPQSNMSLPPHYRRTGVGVGDVGLMTLDGGFDCLFNICLPRTHPINANVPDRLIPSQPLLSEGDLVKFRQYSQNTYLASEQIRADQAHSDYYFETSASEGAILTMPKGLYHERLANIERFNQNIAQNAKDWYSYANNVEGGGRGAGNGDLRLIFSCHKSSAWGMASFTNGSQYPSQRLRFGSAVRSNAQTPTYFWEGSGAALTKFGPEPGENDELETDPRRAMNLLNQCLFVGARTITLTDKAWSNLTFNKMTKNEVQQLQPPGQSPALEQHASTSSQGKSNIQIGDVIIGTGSPPVVTTYTMDYSKALNEHLLQNCPDAEVAVTDDIDWSTILKEDELGNTSASDLYSQISSRCNVYKSSEGLVKFCIKDPNRDVSHVEVGSMLTDLRNARGKIKEYFIGNLPDFQQTKEILHLAFFSEPRGNKPRTQDFPPYLMDKPNDLFVFDRLLQPMLTEEGFATPNDDLIEDCQIPAKVQLYQQLESISFTNPRRRSYYKTLAEITWRLYVRYNRPDDLNETIWLYENAVRLTPTFSVQSVVPMIGLCSALYRRFFIARNLRDLVHLARYARQLDALDIQDLVDQLSHNSAIRSNDVDRSAEQSMGYYLLKLRRTEVQEPHGWTNLLTGNDNIPVPKMIINRDHFKQLFIHPGKSVTGTNIIKIGEYEPPSKYSITDIGSRFDQLIAITCNWVKLPAPNFDVLWLYGPSASQMISHISHNKLLYGMEPYIGSIFTFSDKADWNAEAYKIFPKIAMDLAQYIPAVKEQYTAILAVEGRRNLITSSLAIQFWGLIVDPITKLASYPKHTPTVIINGLDNCGYKTARIILALIADALVIFKLPLRFIITSDKDTRMQDLFNRPFLSKISRQFFVGTVVDFLPDTHDSAKQRLILDPSASRRSEQLIDDFNDDLDAQFTQILSNHDNPKALVYSLGILLVLHGCAQPRTILESLFEVRTEFLTSVLELLHKFEKKGNADHVHPWGIVKKKLPNKNERMSSPFLVLVLLSLSTTMPTAFTIPVAFRDRVHDSFYNFLVNPERSGHFYVDIPFYHGEVSRAGLAFITHTMWRPSRAQFPAKNPHFLLDTWDYLKFHLPDHFAQCSNDVREQVMEYLQDALQRVAKLSSSSLTADVDDFLRGMAIIMDMMVNNWDSFGEWSHISDKNTMFIEHEHKYPEKYKNFIELVDSIREDLSPHRKQMKLKKMISGKLRVSLRLQRDPPEVVLPSLFPSASAAAA